MDGKLTATVKWDPRVRETDYGKVATLFVSRRPKHKDGNEQILEFAAWKELAEQAENLREGQTVTVEFVIGQRAAKHLQWKTDASKKVYVMTATATSIQVENATPTPEARESEEDLPF